MLLRFRHFVRPVHAAYVDNSRSDDHIIRIEI